MRYRKFTLDGPKFLRSFNSGLHPAYKVTADAMPDDAILEGVVLKDGDITFVIGSKQYPTESGDHIGTRADVIHCPLCQEIADA